MISPTEDICQAFIDQVWGGVQRSVKGYMRYLREGAATPVEQYVGRHILALAPLNLTEHQLDALELAILETHVTFLDWLFTALDGDIEPEGWPKQLQLTERATGESVCSEHLAAMLNRALSDYRAIIKKVDQAAAGMCDSSS